MVARRPANPPPSVAARGPVCNGLPLHPGRRGGYNRRFSREGVTPIPAPKGPFMSLRSLIASGTKLWLDSIEPGEVKKNRSLGASGATSNPIIIADIVKGGAFDDRIVSLMDRGLDD